MMAVELDDVAESIAVMRACQVRIAELKTVSEQHRALVEEKMANEEVGTVDGQPVITWKHYKQRRFNQAAFSAANPELLESYKETTETRRLELL
jgi:hypothetical protein